MPDPRHPRVLVLGLDPHRVPGPWDPTPIVEGIAEGQVVNLVRRHAPAAAIAFNQTPADCFEAASRWLDPLG